MEQNLQLRRQKKQIVNSMCYLVIIAGFLLVVIYGRPVFAINDDLGLYSVLTGAYLGYPDAHVSFMEYPFSWAIALLYRLYDGLPWYGLIMEGLLLSCILSSAGRLLGIMDRSEMKTAEKVIVAALFILAWYGMLLMAILRLQYTVVAGACSATALFLFVTSDDTQSGRKFLWQNTGTVIYALLAESIRPEMMLMLLGFAGMLWTGRLGYRLAVTKKCALYVKRYLALLGIFFAGLAAVLLCSRIAYGSREWQDFRQIDRCRVSMFDYYGYPSYEENEEYFVQNGIDRASYEAVKDTQMYPGRNLSVAQWKAVEKLAKTIYDRNHPLKERMAKIFPTWRESMQSELLSPCNQIVLTGYILCLLILLISRKREYTVMILCMLAARMICWSALVYRGRYPDRIVLSMFFMEFAVLTGMMLCMLPDILTKMKRVIPVTAAILLGGILVYCNVKNLYGIRHEYNEEQKQCWSALKSYCLERPGNLYIWTGGSCTLYYYYDEPFSTELTAYENEILMPSGHMMNPNTTEKLAQWGINDLMEAIVQDHRIFLIYQEGTLSDDNSLLTYYRNQYDSFYYKLVDTFQAGNVTYEVYCFRGE